MRSLSSTVSEMPSSWRAVAQRRVVDLDPRRDGRSRQSSTCSHQSLYVSTWPRTALAYSPAITCGHRARARDRAVVDRVDRARPRPRCRTRTSRRRGRGRCASSCSTRTSKPRSRAIVMTESWVMPSSAPAESGGVTSTPFVHDEDVLAGALAHEALGVEQDRLVVAGLQRLDLGERRVDVDAGASSTRGGIDVVVVARPRRDLHAHALGRGASSPRYAPHGQHAIDTSTGHGSVLSPISP